MCRLFYDHNERVAPVVIDQPLSDEEILPSLVEIIHVPGHCAGQVALPWRPGRMLFAGDVCMNITGDGDPVSFKSLKDGRSMPKSP
jgi:glyoxylase-like metal-dependent hydrolase (beta-lactamase superfamily II)